MPGPSIKRGPSKNGKRVKRRRRAQRKAVAGRAATVEMKGAN